LTPANLLLSLKLQKPFLAALRVLSGVFLHRVISAIREAGVIREAIVGALGAVVIGEGRGSPSSRD